MNDDDSKDIIAALRDKIDALQKFGRSGATLTVTVEFPYLLRAMSSSPRVASLQLTSKESWGGKQPQEIQRVMDLLHRKAEETFGDGLANEIKAFVSSRIEELEAQIARVAAGPQ